ncbi:deoxynucleotidyltransferase terminal-interacting protein 2 isoform X4 [Syngnathus acus]|uniref:deoxynucleotidyltransferase terminal-interacting protein 2 isoform X4 n=1 Tax=Syngnathus acus TaxID=161584 RepID=UPI001886415B|nr:deoxynucleotidyltransferase terminal-interacting protein 2 isoform X4 [Syngnathus acus]
MVVTRRGVRVCSPNQTNLEQASHIQATPSTGRRTRSGASQAANSVKTSSRLREDSSDSPTSSLKRCSRAFRLHSPEQPCTPVSSVNEADVSDLDSCSSVTFNADQPVTRSRATCKTGQEESELGSCAPKNVRSTRRSAPNKRVESLSSVVSHSETPAMGSRRRGKSLSITLNFAEDELSDADSCCSLPTVEKTVRSKRSRAAHNVDPVKTGDKEAESSSSLPTDSQRVTRSQKRSTRSSAKAKEFDLSDASSFTSEASPASQSTIRRSARTRKVVPIPLNLDETSTSSSTPSRRTTRRTAAEKSCDSEGFESGSDYAISAKRQAKTPSSSSKNAESDSEQTDGHSTLESLVSSQQHVPMKGLWVVLETSPEGNVLHDSMLETTVVAEDADCTLLEEEKQVSVPSTEAAVNQVKLAHPNEQEVLVVAPDQQHELSAEKQDEDDSAVEKMEEETGSSPSGARCEDVGGDDEKDDDVRTEVSGDDRVLCGSVSTTQEQEDEMEVEEVTCQEVVMEISTEDKDVCEGEPEEAVVSVDERVTPDEPQLEDAKATEKTSTSHPVASRDDEEMELEEEDMGETQGHSGKPEEIAATVVEETTFKKSPLKDMKASKKTKTISLLESGENKEDEDIFDHQVEDTEEQQGPSRKPEKETTAKKSPLKDMKASQKTKKTSLLETEEDEDISDHKVEDTEEQQGPSRKPEKETTATVVEETTFKKSPLKDMKASKKTKTISLLESGENKEDEDIFDHQVEDTEEQQGPSRKPEKETTAKKSPLKDMKASQKTKKTSLLETEEDEDISDHKVEDTEEQQGPSRKPEKETTATVVEETTFKKSPLKDMKASKKTKTISLLESGEDKEDEDISDHQVEDTEEQQGPSRKPEKETTAKKSPLKDMKASQKTKKISLLETEEDEDIFDHQVEDTKEQQRPSRKPKKETTFTKSPLKDMKASQKTKKISLLESSEDEDIFDHQVEDTKEQQGPSRRPKKETTFKKSPLKDMKASQKKKKISLLETEKDEDIFDHKVEDTKKQQGPSRRPKEETKFKKSPLKDMKASQKTKKISLLETEENEDLFDHQVEDTEEQQGPSRRPKKKTTFKKSPLKDMKASQKTKKISLLESSEDEDIFDHQVEDTEKQQGPSRRPKKETTFTKSPLKDMKASQKKKKISLLESSEDEEDEDISDHQVEDTEEQQGPSRRPKKETTFKKSPLKDMKASQKTKKISLLESSEDEDIFDHQVEDTEKQQGPSRRPEKETTCKKSQLKDMKASQKKKKISLLESSEDEEDEDIFDHQVEDTEEQQGPSRRPKKKKKKKTTAGVSVDGLFMVDARPGQEVDEDYYTERLTREEVVGTKKGEEEDDEEFVDEEADDDDDYGEEALLLSSRNPSLKKMSSRIDPGVNMKQLGGLYITFDGSKSKPSSTLLSQHKKKDQDELMKKSVIGSDFEKKEAVPPYTESKKALKLKHRVEREKTTGDAWFNMKAPELTQELKGDLKLLKMRGSMDPKRFYKKNDRDGFPKYFQVATVEDSAIDFYHSRIPKKQRKRTMVEELLADAEFRSNNKKRYQSIVAEKAAQASGKNKKFKKNTFHKKSQKVTK